ncbi:MAG: helix-turn-helix transcriptional regulator [Erysipelotrichaceae bacterium]|nr:helix-turn-helix transcriptional regulator [Erysipelotrichaceae bacterium]MDP3305233.1 helix-turn-helix transcriptional regulator [Erysipelotrichaceae bacterium]
MKIGEKIQQLRKANNLSQEQLAVQLEVSRQAVSRWELNESTPDTDKIILISRIFSVSTDHLLLENPEVSNAIETEGKLSNDLQRSKSMTLAALFISFLGLIISFYSESFYIEFGFIIGMSIQVGAIVFFEIMIQNIEPSIYHKTRKRFYLIDVWLFMFFPTALFASSVLRDIWDIFYWSYGFIPVYFVISTIIFIAIMKLYRLPRS